MTDDEAFAQKCMVSDKLKSNGSCSLWASSNLKAAQIPIKRYCGSHAWRGDSICIDFCKQLSAKGIGVCDDHMEVFCKANPKHPSCTCFNSKLHKTMYNPKCFDSDCLKTGYQSSGMQTTQCPDQINCEMNVNLSSIGVNFSGYKIAQNCGNKTENLDQTTNSSLYYVTSIVVVLMLMGIVLWVKKRS